MNLWSEQRDLICLNCARRIVAPQHVGSKYSPLRDYLWRRGKFTSLATLSFSDIEGIIKNDLPFGALRSGEWWNNNETTSQGYAWTSTGWMVQSVDLKGRTVTFKKLLKEGEERLPRKKKRRRVKKEEQKPFTPVPVKPLKVRKPSRTRIAKAVARAKNVERRRAVASYGVKFKPKPAYEKRLYKPEAKPSSQG